MARETVEFGGRVPREDFDEFKANFPQHGATQWFITTALREFNKLCSSSETTTDMVRDAMRRMVEERS